VVVHGAADKLAAIDEHLFAPALFPKRPEFESSPLTPGPVDVAGGGRMTWFPLEHPGGSVGYRFDWPGHSMAYVTDTAASPTVAYLEAIRGVDLLVHECYFPDCRADLAKLTGHSYTSQVAELAREARVGHLVLTHINPLSDEPDPLGIATARAIFPATDLAFDRMVVEF
jgi:ribonuclease BN (tRNA processing enzyme)